MEWKNLEARPGDRILPRWNGLINRADERRMFFGKDTRVRYLPGGGLGVTGIPAPTILRHPWRMSTPDDENTVIMREGRVGGHRPWVTEELRLSEEDPSTEEPVRIQLTPKDEGFSYVMVGVNVRNGDWPKAELPFDGELVTWDNLRIMEREVLADGFGSGGVTEDAEGWAWYPLVYIEWEDNLVIAQFQFAMHNLGHLVVADQENNARHFFPPV